MVFLSGEVLVSWRREFLDVKTTSRILEGLLAWRGSVEPRKGLVEAACGAEQGHRLRELVRPRPGLAGDKGRTGAACTQRNVQSINAASSCRFQCRLSIVRPEIQHHLSAA